MLRIYKYSIHYWVSVIILFPFFIYSLNFRKYNNAEFLKGEIIHKIEGVAGGRGYTEIYHYPQYQFHYKDSIYYNATEQFDSKYFPVGTIVQIYFPKGKPEKSSIYTFSSFWLAHVELFYYMITAILIFLFPRILVTFYRDIIN